VSALWAKALWFMLPVVLGGLIHVAAIKADWLAPLARRPLDFGLSVSGRRLLGDNKTFRGVMVMIGATALASVTLAYLPESWSRRLAVSPWHCDRPLIWGLLLGTGYILGELPNSAVKRRLKIDPGAAGHGASRSLFWLVDQLDSLAGAFLMLALVWRPSLPFVAAVAGLTLILHPLVAALMVALGLKRRVG
jgi:hypothetical protein